MTVAGKRYIDCTVLGTGSTGDAEDSSYDSDYEAEDSIGSTSVHPQLELQVSSSSHTDVSRTASDTLAAEYEEYVTVQEASASQSPGYAARVEFALKLGYTERLVQAALQKLGPDPGQNELLAELIKLGANCSGKITENSEEPEEIEVEEGEEGSSSSSSPLRPIVIDGSNVAMSHGNKEVFSCRGIKICVDWFKARGHTEITVFVPKWRKEASRLDNPIADQEILGELEKDRLLVFTPSRLVGGKRMVCYDDRYILRLAAELDGVVVSNDNYRDLAQENPEFRKVVEERILMYSFVNDRFMPPDDPLGRSGPTLENFLKIPTKKSDPTALPCPYAKKCTYGNKCKFRHPERGSHPQKSVTERLVEHAQRHLQARGPSLSLPLPGTAPSHQPLCKTRSAAPNSASQSVPSVTKSKSVENVTSEQSSSVSVQSTASSTCAAGISNQPGSHQASLGYRSSVRSPGRSTNPEPEAANLHRKLQRQLTLNPACDPRLYQLRRYHQQQQQQQQQQQNSQTSSSSSSSTSAAHSRIPAQGIQHRPLTRHGSTESSYTMPIKWDHPESLPTHPHVTRIASAPDSYQAWPSGSNSVANSLSDPQLNMPSWMLSRFLDTRTRIHYHLAHIFPEEHVRTAMAIHPFETDPKRICAALLKMERP